MADVYELAQAALQRPRDVALYGRLVPASLRRLRPSAARDAGAVVHLFCHRSPDAALPTPAATPASTLPGAGRECGANARVQVPAYAVVQAAMLRIFTFKDRAETLEWIGMLRRCIFACPHCYRGYLAGRRLIHNALANTYPPKNINDLINFVDRSEQAFLLAHLSRAGVLVSITPPPTTGSQSHTPQYRPRIEPPPPPLQEALSPSEAFVLCYVVGVPAAESLREALASLIESDPEAHGLPASHLVCGPGLVSLLSHPNAALQRWAQKCIQSIPERPADPPPDALRADPDAWQEAGDVQRWQQVLRPWTEALSLTTTPLLDKLALWGHLTLFLSRASVSVVRLALPLISPAALQSLGDSALYFPDALQCYTLALQYMGSRIWPDASEDAEYPSVVLSSILDNKQLFHSLEHSGDDAKTWAWASAHLRSLPIGQDQFATGVKTLAHWTFETMQLPSVPDSLKMQAINHGVALFLEFLEPTSTGASQEDQATMEAQSAIVSQALTLYSSTLVSVALHGRIPNISTRIALNSPSSESSRRLLSKHLQLDAHNTRKAVLDLAKILQAHHQNWKRRPKLRTTSDQFNSSGQLVKRAKDIVADTAKALVHEAAQQTYPLPQVNRKVWEACFAAVQTPASARAAFALLAPPLCAVAAIMEPTPDVLNFTQRDNDQDPAEFHSYRVAVRRSIRSISQALDDMRGPTQGLLQELATTLSESDLNMLCTEHAGEVVQLNLSPEVSTHIGAQNLVRAAFDDVTERIDCFRALLLLNPEAVLGGIETFLSSFVEVADQSMEANKLAEWTVRSLADILDVLTNIRDGPLRPDTPNSFLSEQATRQIVSRHLLETWSLMAKSLAVIFDRTALWSQLLNRDAMVVWFRDVNLFATEMVEQLKTIQDAGALCLPPLCPDSFTLAMVSPLQKAVQWLRLNDSEIMHETLSFVQQALHMFTTDLPLPDSAKNGMLRWVNSQISIKDANKRSTLLTIHQLAALKHQIEVGRVPETIDLDDESDDEGIQLLSAQLEGTSGPADPAMPKALPVKSVNQPRKSSSWWDKAVSVTKAASAQEGKARHSSSSVSPAPDLTSTDRRPPMTTKPGSKQQALNFARAPAPFGKGDKVELNLTRLPSDPTSSTGQPMGKMQQMRAQFRATHNRAPANNSRPIARAQQGPAWDVPDKAPAATTTAPMLASALGARRPNIRDAKQESDASSSSSSSSSSSEDEDSKVSRGIAALRKNAPAPTKGPAAASKIKMIEDEDEARRREQEELERKRRLRAAPDLTLLHKAILSWDLSSDSDKPPLEKPPIRVPKRFASSREYMEVFGPMLQMECWSQLQQSKEQYDDRKTITVEITSRSVVDGFVDVNAVYTAESQNSQINLSDTDLVFFRSQTNPSQEVLAKVASYRRNPRGNQVVFRLFLRNQGRTDARQLNTAIAPRTFWEAGCLFSLATFHRETTALLVSQYLDLRDPIYAGYVPPLTQVPEVDLTRARKSYQLNEPQAQAVLGSLSTQGFSLIQGPPGTGKTKTIVALVARFLSSRPPQPKVDPRIGKLSPPRAKIMICAPSNAAIDEIVRRLKDGVPDENGNMAHPTVIRLGREDSVNSEVRDVSLEVLVERALSTSSDVQVDTGSLREELKQLQQQRQVLQAEMDTCRQAGEDAKANSAQAKLRSVLAKRMTVMSKLDDTRDAQRAQTRERDAERRRMRAQVVMGADIVCSTLSAAGQDTIAGLNIDFETVVIDEAAQAIELSTLIPLRYGCKRCILVGDPNQLPPTVISKPAEQAGYSQSLFLRLFKPGNVYLLSIQYRMHPSISKFPSASFYEGRLTDGPNMASVTQRVWHADTITPSFCFFNVQGSEAAGRFHSFINRQEAQVAVALYERLLHFSPKEDFSHRVGVVTTYKAQVDELRKAFATKYGYDITTMVDFGTVDGFQGQEKDVIILSLVRSSSIGFLADMRRMNVALTRARASLFVLGNADNLRKNKTWGSLADAAQVAGLFKTVTADTIRKTPIQRPKAGVKPASVAASLPVNVAKVNPIDAPQTEDAVGKRMRPSNPKGGLKQPDDPIPNKKRPPGPAPRSEDQLANGFNDSSIKDSTRDSAKLRHQSETPGSSDKFTHPNVFRLDNFHPSGANPSKPTGTSRVDEDPELQPLTQKSRPMKPVLSRAPGAAKPPVPRQDSARSAAYGTLPERDAGPSQPLSRPHLGPERGALPPKKVSKASRAALFAPGRR